MNSPAASGALRRASEGSVRRQRTGLHAFALFALAAGCGPSPPRTSPPAPPPGANDDRFAISGPRAWYLVADGLTPGTDQLTVEVDPHGAPGTGSVDIWIAGRAGQRLERRDGRFRGAFAIGDLPPGAHEVLLAADGNQVAFARLPLRRSHAYYVLMTTDYDFSDPSDRALARMDTLHDEHRELVMTHFWAPYTYTDPSVTPARRAQLSAWLRAQRDEHRDEIALHIHPYCHFVERAGLKCITDQSVVHDRDPSGYTVKCAAYGEAGFARLLETADALFADHDLGKPVTFRAGAWTASIETLRALASRGYVADTSALNWRRIEEWDPATHPNAGSGELWRWNMRAWNPIGDTSQPYRPNRDDVLSRDAPSLSLLEVPDNGAMIDYVSTEEMIAIFRANWDGGPLTGPTTLMLGFHPAPGFGFAEYARVDGILDHADRFLASRDAGPVVYVTLDRLPLAFPR
jgi:hypothetical protein